MHVRFLPKQHERKLQELRTNVLKDTPTIVTKTRFAKTPKEATLVPVKMATVTWTLTPKLEQSVHKLTSASIPQWTTATVRRKFVCDYPPPKKWECIERTPAPTPFPTLSPKEFNCRSNGFTSVALCIACSFLKLRSARDCESTSRVGLDSTPLAGTIPPQIGLLTKLTYLSLTNTQLKGTIPTELGNSVPWSFVSRRERLDRTHSDRSLQTWAPFFILDSREQTAWQDPFQRSLQTWTPFSYLYLKNNGLTGPIPTVIQDFCEALQARLGYCFFWWDEKKEICVRHPYISCYQRILLYFK
jgi:hypothetical protein